jgi:hypothetical protein
MHAKTLKKRTLQTSPLTDPLTDFIQDIPREDGKYWSAAV